MSNNIESQINADASKNDNCYEDSDDDVKFLIYGGDEEGDASDLNLISKKGNELSANTAIASRASSGSNNKDNSTISVSELLKVNNGNNSDNTKEKNNINKKNNRVLNNVSNTIYIDNEDDNYSENPCKDMLMVWDNNPELRPWSRLLDVSPWFNYGFTEKTFKEYIIRQLGIRWERIKRQNIETGDDLLSNNTNASHIMNSSINNLNNIANFNNDEINANNIGNIMGDKNNIVNESNFNNNINSNHIYTHVHHHNINSNNILHHNTGSAIPPPHMSNFLPNVIYYPLNQGQVPVPVTQIPYAHSSYPVIHPNSYNNQKQLYNNFPPPPPHIPISQLKHSAVPPNSNKVTGRNISGNNNSNSNSNVQRNKKKLQE
ncbi:CCAAT-box DNA binding subunit B [Cryptosporidium xiaoi]|uniref:CCAAT-box DNA binding subunit B n=1 Tax=Cryptosporidium xiaoi TaxID=659607 RepID=A0AAV9XY77_9CRYT